MGQITIRNVDDAILQGLKRRAAASGRSTEEEARRALAMAVGFDREAAVARLAAVRARITARADRSAEELIREMRDDRIARLSGA